MRAWTLLSDHHSTVEWLRYGEVEDLGSVYPHEYRRAPTVPASIFWQALVDDYRLLWWLPVVNLDNNCLDTAREGVGIGERLHLLACKEISQCLLDNL